MFDEFGEFDSAEEINRAVAAQLAQGDTEAILAIAAENGIDKEDAEDYINGCMDTLANPVMAALGKLDMEEKELELGGVLSDWVQEIRDRCMSEEAFARAVRKKGKDLAGYIALTADTGYKNRVVVKKEIVEKTVHAKKVRGKHEFAIGIPDRKTRRELAGKYYMEEDR